MRYFELQNDWKVTGSCENHWMLSLPWWLQDEFPLRDGKDVSNWNRKLFAFYVHPGEKLDFPVVIGEYHVMSQKMQMLLKQLAPGAFQFLPFRIRSSIGDDITEGYAVANYRVWLDAVDRKRSKLLPGETRYRRVYGDFLLQDVVLNPKKISDAAVFRVVGCTRLHLYREDVVEKLKRQGLTGLNFIPIAT